MGPCKNILYELYFCRMLNQRKYNLRWNRKRSLLHGSGASYKLAKTKNLANCLVVLQGLFEKTVDGKNWNSGNLRNCFSVFSFYYKKMESKNNSDEDTVFDGYLKKSKDERLEFYPRFGKTNAAVVESRNDPWKKYFSVTRKSMNASSFTK